MSGTVPELLTAMPAELSSTLVDDADVPDELEEDDAEVTPGPVDRPVSGSRVQAGAKARAMRARRRMTLSSALVQGLLLWT
jgi:non-canonical (house-cleaning) NTP pyrophosphatase